MRKTLMIWWIWTVEPFLRHPIRTVRQWFERPELTADDLANLTPEERKALK